MAKSPFFARSKADVVTIVASTPQGIGAHPDVMPRHVAYPLKMLDAGQRAAFPAERVVAPHPAALHLPSLPHRVPGQTRPADASAARK